MSVKNRIGFLRLIFLIKPLITFIKTLISLGASKNELAKAMISSKAS